MRIEIPVMIAAGAAAILVFLVVARLVRARRSHTAEPAGGVDSDTRHPDRISSRSILSRTTVERSVASGAPPTPWMLRREDRGALEEIAAYFARAIPNPTPEGRPYIEDSVGYGGPQLELKVPIVSSRRSVAVVFRSWDAERACLQSNLYIAGTVNDRLGEVVRRAGFERSAFNDGVSTVFRNRRGSARQRTA